MPTRPKVASAIRRRGGAGSGRKRSRAARRSARRGRGSWGSVVGGVANKAMGRQAGTPTHKA
eukprot:6390739-Prymnesium_polylepis.1